QKIPVLLTVGKMEPFKTDEAKRVKADAHIVKPFDASELLAALTKLEDRIVPSSDGRGKSKAKKARMWHSSEDPAKKYEDSNTEQIAYVTEEKNRQAETPSTDQQPAETVASSNAIESPAASVDQIASAPESTVSPEDDPPAATLASATDETLSVPDISA